MRFKLGVLAVFATAAIAVPGSGAGTGASLSTNQQVYTYLASIGVDPIGVVIQRGAKNYAGPDCPGLGWNCTTAMKVVQIAAAGGENQVDCPRFRGPDDEVILVQNTNGGNNNVRCYQESRDTPAAALTFTFTQTNTTGNNFLDVDQRIFQTEGASQMASVHADLTQENVSGDNHLQLRQVIDQSTSAVSSDATQSQDGFFASPLRQENGSGNNFSHYTTELKQTATTKEPGVTQSQFGDHDGTIEQAHAVEGPDIASDATATGFSKSIAHQSETLRAIGGAEASQVGPQFCCTTQSGGDPQNTLVDIHQDSNLTSTDEFAVQTTNQTAHCTTVGTCRQIQHARIDEDRITVHVDCSGTFVEDAVVPCTRESTTTCTSVEATEEEYAPPAGCIAPDDEVTFFEHAVTAHPW